MLLNAGYIKVTAPIKACTIYMGEHKIAIFEIDSRFSECPQAVLVQLTLQFNVWFKTDVPFHFASFEKASKQFLIKS